MFFDLTITQSPTLKVGYFSATFRLKYLAIRRCAASIFSLIVLLIASRVSTILTASGLFNLRSPSSGCLKLFCGCCWYVEKKGVSFVAEWTVLL